MSQTALEKIIGKTITDGEFRTKLLYNPDSALKNFETKLTPGEVASIKALNGETIDAFKAVLGQKAETRWWLPSSFRELGTAILSLILIFLLLVVLQHTYALMGTPPFTVKMDRNSTMMIDPYARAKDLLDLVFPLFPAVVTFWLGVSVEGRRADLNMGLAKEEQGSKEQMMMAASNAMSEAEGQVMRIHDAVTREPMPNNDILLGLIKDLLQMLKEGQSKMAS